MGEKFTFYLGEYATVTASGMPGCSAGCTPLASTVEVDAHVVFAGTRIASVKPSRTLYYYRTRLGTVVATSFGRGVPGAGYTHGARAALWVKPQQGASPPWRLGLFEVQNPVFIGGHE